jgi:hypothetical protein
LLKEGLPFYGTELAFLAPLLTAYDDKIAKLEKVL